MALLCIALYPNIIYGMVNHTGLSYIITSVILILPIISIILIIPYKSVYCVFVVLLTIISIIELTMVDLYNSFLQPGAIISTLWTTYGEASQFFHVNSREVLRWIPLVLLCIYACCAYKKLEMNFPYRIIIYACMILVPILFVIYKVEVFYKGNNRPITLRYYMDNRVWNRSPYNVPFQCYNAYKILEQRNLIALAQKMNFGAYRKESIAQKEIYVLAIGESMRYDNLSLNGTYSRETTPLLEKQNNLVLFDDYYSQSCLTMFSVPMLVTRATPEDFNLNYHERSIIAPFNECGFSTYVIANSNMLAYQPYLSYGCDSLIQIQNVVKEGKIISGDKTIIHIIDSLADCHDKLFVVCQFLGNHSFYANYECEFDIYHPNSNDTDIGYSEETLTNAYDNSILYADYILSSIIDVIHRENTLSAMIFVSDHGEFISNDGAGHGGTSTPTKEEYHVPFIFWSSETYVEHNPQALSFACAHKKSRCNGDNIFYSVCGMAGITLDSVYSKPKWNVLSADYKEHERFLLDPDGVTITRLDL